MQSVTRSPRILEKLFLTGSHLIHQRITRFLDYETGSKTSLSSPKIQNLENKILGLVSKLEIEKENREKRKDSISIVRVDCRPSSQISSSFSHSDCKCFETDPKVECQVGD